MNKNLHNIEELFHNSLEGIRDSPSPDLWGDIEAKLDQNDAINYKRKFSGLKKMAAVVLFFLLSIVIYQAYFITGGKTIAINHNDIKKTNPQENSEQGRSMTYPVLTLKRSNENLTLLSFTETPGENDYKRIINPSPGHDQNTYHSVISPGPGILSENDRYIKAGMLISLPEGRQITDMKMPVNLSVPSTARPAHIAEENLSSGVSFNNKLPHLFKSRWTFTGVGSYERTQYRLDNDVRDNMIRQQDPKSEIAEREEHEPSFSAGVLVSRQFKKKWALQTGLMYSHTQIAIRSQKIYAEQDDGGEVSYEYNASSGYAFIKPGFGPVPVIGDSITATEAKHNLSYLSVPVVLQYKWTNKRITISPGAGLSLNTFLSAKIETEVKDAMNREIVTINKLKGVRRMYAGFIANADIEYNLKGNWSVNLIPSFKYAITAINKNNVVKTYPYSLGLTAGVSCRF